MDEVVNFIRHEDFRKALEFADKLKHEKEQRQHDVPTSSLLHPRKKTRELCSWKVRRGCLLGRHQEKYPNSYDDVAELIRATLLPSAIGSDIIGVVGVMGPGESMATEFLINDTINSLANELKLCLRLKEQRRTIRESQISDTVRLQDDLERDDNKINPYANNVFKFSKRQTDILTNWMIAHSVGFDVSTRNCHCRLRQHALTASFALTQENPFPTHAQISELAKATGLTETQVVNWTTNVRKRNLKGTVELGKKPHHFLDYLFLAIDREKQMRNAHPEMDTFMYKGIGLTPRALTRNHKGSREADPLGRVAIEAMAYPTSRAPTVFNPTLADHDSSRPNFDLEQPDIHRRSFAVPRAQKKTKCIFRRGKQLSDLDEGGVVHVKENPGRNERDKEAERSMLREYTQVDIDHSESFPIVPIDDVGHNAFDEYDELYHPKIVSFESMCDEPLPFEHDVSFDENMASYLGMMFANE